MYNTKPIPAKPAVTERIQLEGDTEVYDMLNKVFKADIDRGYSVKRYDFVPFIEGIGLVERLRDENDKGNFYSGTVTRILSYEDIPDITSKVDAVLQRFYQWRNELRNQKPSPARDAVRKFASADFRRLNNSLTFFTLVQFFNDPDSLVMPEQLTVFYCGYSATNIRSGEWFNRDQLDDFSDPTNVPLNFFVVTEIDGYSTVNAIRDPSRSDYHYRFNMSIGKEVYRAPIQTTKHSGSVYDLINKRKNVTQSSSSVSTNNLDLASGIQSAEVSRTSSPLNLPDSNYAHASKLKVPAPLVQPTKRIEMLPAEVDLTYDDDDVDELEGTEARDLTQFL